MRWLFVTALFFACAGTTRSTAVVADVAPAAVPEVVRPVPTWVPTPPPPPLAAMTRTRPEARTHTLKNGLKVVVVEDHRVRLVKTRLFLPGGSAGESEERAGATYFALALLGDTFDEKDGDGRPVRPLEKSARYLATMAGSQLQFDVSPDSAWVGLDGYSVDSASLLRRLNAVVTDRRHGEESFQARNQSVADMVNELELTDGTVLEQYLTQLAFGAAHPYARPIFGTPRSLTRLGLEDITERQNELLTPVGSTLLVAGDVKSDEVFKRVEAAFGGWKGAAVERVYVPPPQVTKRRSVVFLPRKPSRNTLVCLARPLSDVKGSAAATSLAVAVLGEARISAVIREKLGLTYSVTSAMVERRAARALLICARVRATETINAARLMLEQVAAFSTTPPTAAELEQVRAMAITRSEMSQDDLPGIVEAWQHAAVMKEAAPSVTAVAELRQTTLEEVASISKKLSSVDTVQVIFSGERPLVEAAARANGLGPLTVPVLARVTE